MTDSTLADMILEDRRRGLNYHAIGTKHGIDPIDARALVREVLEKTSDEDEWELRAISLLRLETVVQNLWTGVEQGSFKHAEALFKGLDQINQLLALNKQVVEDKKNELTDEQVAVIYQVVTENNTQIYNAIIDKLKPNKKQMAALEEWPAIASDAATNAIEATIVDEDDD